LGPGHQVVMPGGQNRGIIAHGHNGDSLKVLKERACSAKIYTQVAHREFIVICCQYLFK
jgi:hypothetical protein